MKGIVESIDDFTQKLFDGDVIFKSASSETRLYFKDHKAILNEVFTFSERIQGYRNLKKTNDSEKILLAAESLFNEIIVMRLLGIIVNNPNSLTKINLLTEENIHLREDNERLSKENTALAETLDQLRLALPKKDVKLEG